MKKRIWTPDEKLQIVIEGIRNETTIAEICRRHQICGAQYYKWKDRFFEGAKKSLSSNYSDNENKGLLDKLKEYQRIIGKQVMQIEILKKTLSHQEEI